MTLQGRARLRGWISGTPQRKCVIRDPPPHTEQLRALLTRTGCLDSRARGMRQVRALERRAGPGLGIAGENTLFSQCVQGAAALALAIQPGHAMVWVGSAGVAVHLIRAGRAGRDGPGRARRA
jgi:hypothetical protein